jgi:hypothetical protein
MNMNMNLIRHWVGLNELEGEQSEVLPLSDGPSAKDNLNWRWNSEERKAERAFWIHRVELMTNARNQVYPLDWGFSFVSGFFPVGHQARWTDPGRQVSSVYIPLQTAYQITVFVPGDYERPTMDGNPLQFAVKYYYSVS